MADSGGRVDLDPDDWFAEAEPPRLDLQTAAPEPAADEPADDWLAGAEPPQRPRRARVARGRARLVAAGAVLVVVLLGGLALAGVFSSSHHPAAAPPTHASVPRSTTAATTTQTTTRQPLPAPTATLQNGGTGSQVSTLQRALARLGYATGAVDGIFGPKTAAAVAAFQKSAGLTADAIVGPLTRAALVRALARQASG